MQINSFRLLSLLNTARFPLLRALHDVYFAELVGVILKLFDHFSLVKFS